MKHLVILIIALIAITSLPSVIRTVDINTPSIGQYNNWYSAYNAAANGDTIYLYPSLVDYGSQYIAKNITIVGAGFDPANPSLITTKFTPYVNAVGGTGARFIGLDCGSSSYTYPVQVSNCRFASSVSLTRSGHTFTDCNFKSTVYVGDGTTQTSDNVFTSCFFDCDTYKVYLQPLAAIILFNSIFYGNSYHVYCGGNYTNAAFNHCLFVNRGTGTQYLATGNTSTANLVFTNSIFEAISNIPANFTYLYNIWEGTSSNVTDPSNLQGVNLANVMVDVNGGNYHLITGSLASGAGQSGVDIGIYGGTSPFDDLWYLTFLANITDFDCPAIVNQAGQLNLHIQAQCGN